MPVFEIQRNGETFQIDAPDETTALGALGNTKPQAPQAGDASVFKQAPAQQQMDPREAFAAGLGNVLTFGQSPVLAGALNYARTGGSPGSYDYGKQEMQQRLGQASDTNPFMYGAGEVASLAVPTTVAPRAVGLGLRGVGKVAELSSWPATFIDPYLGTALKLGGRGLSAVGRALSGARSTEPPSAPPGPKGPELTTEASTGARGVSSGVSPHERINSLADALRKRQGTMSREDYMKRAATYARRGKSYEHRVNVERDYPENY